MNADEVRSIVAFLRVAYLSDSVYAACPRITEVVWPFGVAVQPVASSQCHGATMQPPQPMSLPNSFTLEQRVQRSDECTTQKILGDNQLISLFIHPTTSLCGIMHYHCVASTFKMPEM